MIHYKPYFGGAIKNDVGHLLQHFFQDQNSAQCNKSATQWAPRVDIKEEANRFVILADIPGVDPNEIEIQMEKNVLSIKGARSTEVVAEGEKLTLVERARGEFNRGFTLPESADAEAIKASGKNGVLEIVIPKKADTAARRIKIDMN